VPSHSRRYFADENALGLAKLLIRAGRSDVVHPDHESLPELPLGPRDLAWMPVAAALGLIVLSRDRRIRTPPAELAAYRQLRGIASPSRRAATRSALESRGVQP
jgi:PIN domain-containing protein